MHSMGRSTTRTPRRGRALPIELGPRPVTTGPEVERLPDEPRQAVVRLEVEGDVDGHARTCSVSPPPGVVRDDGEQRGRVLGRCRSAHALEPGVEAMRRAGLLPLPPLLPRRGGPGPRVGLRRLGARRADPRPCGPLSPPPPSSAASRCRPPLDASESAPASAADLMPAPMCCSISATSSGGKASSGSDCGQSQAISASRKAVSRRGATRAGIRASSSRR